MRGFLYEIDQNPENLGSITKVDFFEGIGVVAEWFSDGTIDDLEPLLDRFHEVGAEIGVDQNYPYFVLTSEVKQNHFRQKFQKAKSMMKEMTLEEFSKSTLETLRHAIENDWDDAVYTGGAIPIPLDRWIREAKTGVKYYLGNVVVMH